MCNVSCDNGCQKDTGVCNNCTLGLFGDVCGKECSTCPAECDRITGECIGECTVGKFGKLCNITCDLECENGCSRITGVCNNRCEDFCNKSCNNFEKESANASGGTCYQIFFLV